MAKRTFLFILVNFVTVLTISAFLTIFHLNYYLTKNGINYNYLMIFCLLWGFSGSFISLALSRILARKTMGIHIIPPNTADVKLQGLLRYIHDLARRSGIKTMPQVGIYDSDEINAFATGPTKNRALIAVSVGLLKRMSTEQIQGVLAHELSHIANGDMVTLALVQGVVNSFVMFFARIVAFLLLSHVRESVRTYGQRFLIFVCEIIFSIFGSMIVCAVSRQREYRADEGSARLVGGEKIVSALESLKVQSNLTHNSIENKSLAALKIYGKQGRWVSSLFATHPSLDKRIAYIEKLGLH
jgi:heat shock protein HtpX